MTARDDPRLCYVGSLPVEATSAGPMQLYRLLQAYPQHRLRVVEVDCLSVQPALRLPGVEYRKIRPLFSRGWYFTRMRLPKVYWFMLKQNAAFQARQISRQLEEFRPEAVLTVHDQFGWISAAELSRSLRIPLHLILHDDWFRDIPMSKTLNPRFETHFAEAYRSALSRLCVSPYMEEEYTRRFGVPGTVLYPIRAREDADNLVQLTNGPGNERPLTVAYAGNVWHQGNWQCLRDLATALRSIGGNLVIFGPTTVKESEDNGLAANNVSIRGFSTDLVRSLREEAHALFVPMTFELKEKRNMQISFPSKLTDYSAAGLPLLIYGPEYCSAVRWANDNPGAAEVVLRQGSVDLNDALKRLLDPKWRETLARRVLAVGQQYFSWSTGTSVFRQALCAAPTGRSPYGPPCAAS